ncbi:hypothetical protein V6N13_141571 [Hibiscus sabdariffa]|uniref:Uncharacterized protein n=2 Tax=Hibiscus sabdariffa TaxID=183260 RepID=A0ABR2BK85_9ROSI
MLIRMHINTPPPPHYTSRNQSSLSVPLASFPTIMDLQDIQFLIAIAALERKREEKRRTKKLLRARRAALREKVKQCELLKTKKQEMLAEEAPKEKMVDDFMVFIEAIEKNDTETVQRFDEKSMMIAIGSMAKGGGGHSGHNGGFAADGDEN